MLNRFTFLLLLSASAGCGAAVVSVTDAWIAEGPPSVPVNAGYLRIDNTGADTITLVAIESPLYARIEIHESKQESGIAAMAAVDRPIAIAPGRRLTLAPGGLHLMIYNDGTPPVSGAIVPLRLRFADGTISETKATVRKMSDYNHHQQHAPAADTGIIPKLQAACQYLLPQHLLSSLMHRLTRMEWEPLKNLMIRNFIRLYNVDMSIAVIPEAERYRHFNEFFTRALKPEARPIDPAGNAIVSPVDGAVSQYGRINDGRLLQAKGHYFTTTELLGGNVTLGERFRQGEFITLYLSPRDYHRIHMPISGTLESMTYIPGDLFSVSPATTQAVDNLFARNERVVQIFETAAGKVALVMVGAIFVGSMETVWAGEITPDKDRQAYTLEYPASGRQVSLEKGLEMGRFNMGSTVVLLFEPGRIGWEPAIGPDHAVRLGQRIATLNPG